MYAIVKTGGKQYKVAEGDVIEVEKLIGAPGDAHLRVDDRGGPEDPTLFLDHLDLDPHAAPPREVRARSARKR